MNLRNGIQNDEQTEEVGDEQVQDGDVQEQLQFWQCTESWVQAVYELRNAGQDLYIVSCVLVEHSCHESFGVHDELVDCNDRVHGDVKAEILHKLALVWYDQIEAHDMQDQIDNGRALVHDAHVEHSLVHHNQNKVQVEHGSQVQVQHRQGQVDDEDQD